MFIHYLKLIGHISTLYTWLQSTNDRKPEFSDSTTVADDDGGKTIDAVFLYLTESRYASGSSDIFKRAIRRKAAMCVVRDGVLYVQKKKKNDPVSV